MSAVERAAEVIERAFLDTRQGKMGNDWVTGEEVAEYLADAGLLLSDADRAVLDAARHLIDLAITESRIVTEAEHLLAFQALVDADRARRGQP